MTSLESGLITFIFVYFIGYDLAIYIINIL